MPPRRSCLECRRRKIKCSRTEPCEYCTKLNLRCRYPARRSRPPLEDEDGSSRSPEVTRELLTRISNLERLLEQSIASNNAHIRLKTSESSPIALTAAESLRIEDGSRSNSRSTTEVLQERPRSVVGIWDIDGNVFCKIPSSWQTQWELSLRFPLINVSADYRAFLPTTDTTMGLWQAYAHHVDPVWRLFHAPSMRKQFTAAIANPLTSMPPDLAALLFASLFAGQAQSPYHCTTDLVHFDPTVSARMLQQLHYGIQSSLAAAEYMRVPSMLSLQALVLFLACARQYLDPTLAWSLIGIARQLGLKLGLNMETDAIWVTPFDREMRRRLWHHILVLEVRIAERNGLEPASNAHDLRVPFPANVDDQQISPDMVAIPDTVQPTSYDMLYPLLRFELGAIARRILFSPSFNQANGYPVVSTLDKMDNLENWQGELEKKYFTQAPEDVVMVRLCAASVRMMLAKYRLFLQYTSTEKDVSPESARKESFRSALAIMKNVQRLQKLDSRLRIWWMPQEYLEWDAAVVVLREVIAGQEHIQDQLNEARQLLSHFFVKWRRSTTSLLSRKERWAYLLSLYHACSEALGMPWAIEQIELTDVSTDGPAYNTSQSGIPETAVNSDADSSPLEAPWVIRNQFTEAGLLQTMPFGHFGPLTNLETGTSDSELSGPGQSSADSAYHTDSDALLADVSINAMAGGNQMLREAMFGDNYYDWDILSAFTG